MKVFSFVLILAFGIAACARHDAGLQIRPLAPERSGDIGDFLANLSVVDQNLNAILNVLDSPEKRAPAEKASAREQLNAQMKLADEYILRADTALARQDLPRNRENTLVSFPRIGMVVAGSEDADVREAATARSQILAAQFSLLNLRVGAKPSPDADKRRVEYENWLADGRAGLAAASKP